MLTRLKYATIFITILVFPIFLFLFFQYISKAAPIKADISIDAKKMTGPFPTRWKAFAQGGEELGIRMLENVISPMSGLYPRYIRLDHIYDGYDVVKPDGSFDFSKLDETICDIYHTGAKPFLSLGYMPPVFSDDGSVIGAPKNWDDWSLLVQKTVEHYSGKSTRLCGQVTGSWFKDIYYEVWNEPDLETFGKWSLYGGNKDYKKLYYYSAQGANRAQNVNRFLIGGPATTALYQNWIQQFLDYVSENNLRLDFISWHHYSKNANDYVDDITRLNSWLDDPQYRKYKTRARIISEWGFDSDPNVTTDTDIGAAYTVASIRNFINQTIEAAFLFEIKDGLQPRWGILSHDGAPKSRYNALKLMNVLKGYQLLLTGEGTYITGLATIRAGEISTILTNYDLENKNTEEVPVRFIHLRPTPHDLSVTYLDGKTSSFPGLIPQDGTIEKMIIMPPNSVVSLELKPN